MDRFAGTTAGESLERAVQAGREAFGPAWTPDGVAIAPGRIELLGNHVDYNGGPVLAAAIDRFIVVAVARSLVRSRRCVSIAADAPDEAVATLDARALAGWRNASPPPESLDYVRGLLAGLQAPERSSLRPRLPASIAIAGDVPIGFGVSSSAALCVSLALALADGFSGPEEIVLLAQEAEHRAGTPCGTMDQSASVCGRGHRLRRRHARRRAALTVSGRPRVCRSGLRCGAQPEHLLLSAAESRNRGRRWSWHEGSSAQRSRIWPRSPRSNSTPSIATASCRSPS